MLFGELPRHQQRKLLRLVAQHAQGADTADPVSMHGAIEQAVIDIWPNATVEDDSTHLLITDVYAHLSREGGLG